MRKFLIAFFTVTSALFGLAILVGLFLPNTFAVSRSVPISASAESVYALVGNLERWSQWGPWKDADASLEVTLGEKTSGVGASQSWVGADGTGRLVFTEAAPQTGVSFDLFFNDDAFANVSSITYVESGDGLTVTWEMGGSVPAPIIGGYLAMLMPSLIEPMFDDGLAKLKAAAEAEEQARAGDQA